MPKIVARKKDWLKLGYVLFSREGIKGIVVERIAAKLKCNKSSFYWHFESKEKFMQALVDYWVQSETIQIMASVDEERTPQARYDKFLRLVFQPDPYVDFIFFLKRYARHNETMQNAIEEVDERRIAFTTKIFIQLGDSAADASIKANAFYKYLIGFHELTHSSKGKTVGSKEIHRELECLLRFSTEKKGGRRLPTNSKTR